MSRNRVGGGGGGGGAVGYLPPHSRLQTDSALTWATVLTFLARGL